ncbi:hypothetical protein FM106_31850 [Brachybacterium faecium]|nr:hypothetical protein FM106_31850 [Brachybacterium faecium]
MSITYTRKMTFFDLFFIFTCFSKKNSPKLEELQCLEKVRLNIFIVNNLVN